MTKFNALFEKTKPVIGMVHLRPLPGSPLYDPAAMNMEQMCIRDRY